MKLSNNIKVALTVLGALLVAFVGYRYMKDMPIFGQGKVISAVFPRSEGLAPGRAISMRGVQIGTIRSVELMPSDSVLIEMNIDSEIEITRGSKAVIRSADLLGTKIIEIERGDSSESVDQNARIAGEIEQGGFDEITELGTTIGNNAVVTTEMLNSILASVDSTLDAQTRRDLKAVAANMAKMSETLDRMLAREEVTLSATLSNLKNITASIDSLVAENRKQIGNVVANLDTTSASVHRLTEELARTSSELTATLQKINNGEGTLGKLAADSSLYHHIDSLTVTMNQLLKNLDENPRRYLRGLIKIF